MTIIETKVKKWGNSFGVVIPSEVIVAKQIKENEDIGVIIIKDSRKVLRDTFGIGKGKIKKTGQEFKDEARRELYS